MSQMVVNGNSWSTYLCHIFLISQWLYPKKICEERPWPERGWPSLCSAGVCVWLHTGSRCQLCRKKTRLWLTGPGDCPLFVSKIEPKDGSFAVRQMSPTVSLPTPAARLMFCKLLHCEPTGRKSMNVTAHLLFTISIHFPSEETRS